LWSGLGYYRRARMLHEGARAVARDFGGTFPDTAEGLQAIRGIGRYTAGAIASIAFGRQAALVDGNVVRVFARLFGVHQDVRGGQGLARIWRIAEAIVPADRPGDWNQALMELGATVCLPKNPQCLLCPLRDACAARHEGLEAELPRLEKKKPPRPVARVALVAEKGGGVLLGRRRAGGLFGGLWEPPLVDARTRSSEGEQTADVADRFAAFVRASFGPAAKVGDVVHVLSHRRLTIAVFRATLRKAPASRKGPIDADAEYEAFRVVPVNALQTLPMSTLARKVLKAAKVE
jgi:A/G-specific adenine glycosylase